MEFNKSKNITIFVLIVVVLLLLLKDCSGSSPTETTIEHYTDTTYVTHIDTIEFIKDTTITKTILTYTDVTNLEADSSKLYTFQSHVSDSLIDGDITTEVKIKDSSATLLNQEIRYTPKFPKYIYQTDSVFIHDSTVVTKYENKMHLLLGANVMLNQQGNSITPTLGLQFKNKTIIEAGYDPFNNGFLVGAKFKLKLKK